MRTKNPPTWIFIGLGLAAVGTAAILVASVVPGKSAAGQISTGDRGFTVGPGCIAHVTNESLALKWAADLGTKATGFNSALQTAFGCDVQVADKGGLIFLYKFRYALGRALLGSGVLSVVEFQERVAADRFDLEKNELTLEGLPGDVPNGFTVTPDCDITVTDEPLALLWAEYVAATKPWADAVGEVYSGCNPDGKFGDPAAAPFVYRILHAMLKAAIGQETRTMDEANAALTQALGMMKAANIGTDGLPELFV